MPGRSMDPHGFSRGDDQNSASYPNRLDAKVYRVLWAGLHLFARDDDDYSCPLPCLLYIYPRSLRLRYGRLDGIHIRGIGVVLCE